MGPVIVALSLLGGGLWLAFFAYFRPHGIDLFEATVGVNLGHSLAHRETFLGVIRSGALRHSMPIAVGLVVWAGLSGRPVRSAVCWGVAAWAAASIVHALLTGKMYYHYFIPIYLPVCAFLVERWNRGVRSGWLLPSIISASVIAVILLGAGVGRAHEFAKRERRLTSEICAQTREHSTYVADPFLAAYRVCKIRPNEFMFPPFVFDPHFVELSDSRDVRELDGFALVLLSRESPWASVVESVRDSGIVYY